MAQIVHEDFNTNGVKLILGDGLSKFTSSGKQIHLESGLAKKTDLLVGLRGYIVTTPKLEVLDTQTQKVVEGVYAIADAIQVKDFITHFLSGDKEYIRPEEATAILFAQYYADNKGIVDRNAYNEILTSYGDSKTAAIQIMMIGNIGGRPISGFREEYTVRKILKVV